MSVATSGQRCWYVCANVKCMGLEDSVRRRLGCEECIAECAV